MAELFLIRKGGYYYRPNAQGYTASVHEAGRYPEAEAVAHMEACDPGEIVIFPAPAISASIPVEEDSKLTAEKIVLEHVASGTMNMNNLAAAIASALEKERSAAATPAPVKHVVGDQHPDDLAVDRFAATMKAKLAKKRDEGRGGWEHKEHCSNAFLSRLLVEHVQKGDPVDVGNLAMMIHQRGEGIGVAAGNASAIAQLNAIVDAWEALPGGRQVKNSDIERWLAKHMGPGIDAIRGFLRRPRPDGILPPSPQTREGGSP